MSKSKERSLESQKIVQENALQLYIYENLCCTPIDRLKKFLTNMVYRSLKNIKGSAKLKVVIPEYPVIYTNSKGEKKQHKVDFRLIDKNNNNINVEVEWKVSNFNSHGKEVYDAFYKGDKGFIIALEDDRKLKYIEQNNIKIISPSEFSLWFTYYSKELIDRTILNKISDYDTGIKKVWMIPLLGGATINFKNNVLDSKGSKKKWGFPYIHFNSAMKNIFDIKTGDAVIFIGGFRGHGGKKGEFEKSTFSILEIGKVTTGYYCDIHDNTFEDPTWISTKITEKKYMHYFQFELDKYDFNVGLEQIESEEARHPLHKYLANQDNLKIWTEVCTKIKWSSSQLSCPVQITEEMYKFLLQMILQYKNFKEN